MSDKKMTTINIDVKNKAELNHLIQKYTSEGYHIDTNINDTVVLKKGYNTFILIILILFLIIGAIIYYVLSEEDVILSET